MHSETGSGVRRSILRLAVAAALVAFVIPLLPLYGSGGQLTFIFSLGLPARGLIEYLLGRWNSAIVVTIGIVFLRRDHLGFVGGIFAAVALGLVISIIVVILVTAPHFGHWQTDVVLGLEIVEVILLALAAARAIGQEKMRMQPSRVSQEQAP
jgi:hypothetical protein